MNLKSGCLGGLGRPGTYKLRGPIAQRNLILAVCPNLFECHEQPVSDWNFKRAASACSAVCAENLVVNGLASSRGELGELIVRAQIRAEATGNLETVEELGTAKQRREVDEVEFNARGSSSEAFV